MLKIKSSQFELVPLLLLMTIVVSSGFVWADAYEDVFPKMLESFKKGQLKEIDETIQSLPSPYKENFILIGESGSLQHSTYESPRVLLYDELAENIFSFGGDPKLQGYDSIELVRNRPDGLEFYHIRFKSLRSKTSVLLDKNEILFENNKVVVSKPNPSVCMSCHGIKSIGGVSYSSSQPKYIFAEYPHWPGVIGSSHSGGRAGVAVGETEYEAIKSFVERPGKRYQYLKFLFSENEIDSDRVNKVYHEFALKNFEFGALIAIQLAKNYSGQILKAIASDSKVKQSVKQWLCDFSYANAQLEHKNLAPKIHRLFRRLELSETLFGPLSLSNKTWSRGYEEKYYGRVDFVSLIKAMVFEGLMGPLQQSDYIDSDYLYYNDSSYVLKNQKITRRFLKEGLMSQTDGPYVIPLAEVGCSLK